MKIWNYNYFRLAKPEVNYFQPEVNYFRFEKTVSTFLEIALVTLIHVNQSYRSTTNRYRDTNYFR